MIKRLRLVNPFSHPHTWGVTILMGLFLNILYFSFRMILKGKPSMPMRSVDVGGR